MSITLAPHRLFVGDARQLPRQPEQARRHVVTTAPAAAALEATAQQQQDLLSVGMWQAFGSALGLSVGRDDAGTVVAAGAAANADAMRQQMRLDGYSSLAQSEWDSRPEDSGRLKLLDRLIDELEAAGLPSQFMLVFDEVWELVNAVSRALEPVYGLRNVMDFYVFNVKPGKHGWSLHRDRPEGQVGFKDDGLPEYTTVWVALTDANPTTSCIYILPAHADPEYKTMSGSKLDMPVVTFALPHVRALPVERGTVLTWSHRALHWGSACPESAPHARKTLTFAMASPSYEQPYIDVAPGQLPEFEQRLALVAYTLISYHHSQPVPLHMQASLVEIVLKHSEHLSAAAIHQSTGESFFKNILSFAQQAGHGDPELPVKVEQAGEQLLQRFGLSSAWWRTTCANAQR